jgi:hypothetical protein
MPGSTTFWYHISRWSSTNRLPRIGGGIMFSVQSGGGKAPGHPSICSSQFLRALLPGNPGCCPATPPILTHRFGGWCSRASGWSCCSGVGARTFSNGASCGGYLSEDERACNPSGPTACSGRVAFLRRRSHSGSSIMKTIPGTKHLCHIRCAGQLMILQPRSRRSTLLCAATLPTGFS